VANVTVPFPEPDDALVKVIQLALLEAFHPQPGLAVTAIVGPAPPAADTETEIGAMLYEHAPGWLTENSSPAIVTSPERDVEPAFAATFRVTTPLPVPDCPLWTPIHDTALAAVH
jgi:hypothetical protein